MLPERVWFDADAGHWEECNESYSTNCVKYIRADIAAVDLCTAIVEAQRWRITADTLLSEGKKQLAERDARIVELENMVAALQQQTTRLADAFDGWTQ